MKQAIVGLLIKDNKVLTEIRASEDSIAPSKQCFIAGHVKKNESLEDCLKRELKEELGIKVIDFKRRNDLDWVYDFEEKTKLNYFIVKKWNGLIKPRLGNKLKWISKKQANKMSYVKDQKIVEKVLQ